MYSPTNVYTRTYSYARPREAAHRASVGGSGGCNTYRGDFAVDGETISIGPLASTKRGCPGPAGEIETTYLAALDAAGLWAIDAAGHLVLTGPTPLTFEPG